MSSQTPVTNQLPLINVPEATASEIRARLYLDKAALGLLRPDMSPRGFVDALVEAKQYMAGIDFLAHALPSREAIWWGCLSLQRTFGNRLEPWERRAFRITVQWVLQPDEPNREAAKQPAEVLGPASAIGNLASAVYQTGYMILPQGPPLAPSPFAPARAVAIAIKVASTKVDAREIQPMQKSLIELGMGVAEGRFVPKGFQ